MCYTRTFTDRVKDDYLANRILRDDFRVKRKADKAQKEVDDALRQKSSLDIDLVPEHKDDIATAALMKFQTAETPEEKRSKKLSGIEQESIFRAKAAQIVRSGKKEDPSSKKERSKKNLVGIVNRHKLKTAMEKNSSPLKNIGVVLKKKAKDEDKAAATNSCDEPEAGTSGISSKSNEANGSQSKKASGLGSLCAYESSSDSD